MNSLWSIGIIAKNDLSDKDKDLIAEIIDSESHNAIKEHSFVLHEIFESDKSLEIIIEGKKSAAINIKNVLIDNIFLLSICN